MELIRSTTLTSSLQARKSQGSSGISEQKRMTAHRMNKINMYQAGVKTRSLAVQNSLDKMDKKVKQLIR